MQFKHDQGGFLDPAQIGTEHLNLTTLDIDLDDERNAIGLAAQKTGYGDGPHFPGIMPLGLPCLWLAARVDQPDLRLVVP